MKIFEILIIFLAFRTSMILFSITVSLEIQFVFYSTHRRQPSSDGYFIRVKIYLIFDIDWSPLTSTCPEATTGQLKTISDFFESVLFKVILTLS